jgi:hypothetical protein
MDRPSPAAGNGIFGCGDRPPKIAPKMGERSQRQKSGKRVVGNPRRNGLFGVVPETRGLRRLDGGGSRAQTGDPPPSHRTGLRRRAGNGNLRCRTGTQKPAYQLAEINPDTQPHSGAINAKKADGSLNPTARVDAAPTMCKSAVAERALA